MTLTCEGDADEDTSSDGKGARAPGRLPRGASPSGAAARWARWAPLHVDPDLGLELVTLGVADPGPARSQVRLELTLSLTVGELVWLAALTAARGCSDCGGSSGGWCRWCWCRRVPARRSLRCWPGGGSSGAGSAHFGAVGPRRLSLLEAVTQAMQPEQQHRSGVGVGVAGSCGLSLGRRCALRAVLGLLAG